VDFGKRIWGGKERGPKGQGNWRLRAEWGSQGAGSPTSYGGLGSTVSSPSWVEGGAPAAKGFSRILNTQDNLSGQQDYGPWKFYFFGFLAKW